MEVARKGIFHPQFFTMPELMTIFLAVMLTDILLLDLYNTFGLPTSTTVSIVFELLGAAIAVSLFKIFQGGQGIMELAPKYREPLLMQVVLGYSCKEISEQLGVSKSAVMTQLFRAREQLKQKLHKDGVTGNVHGLF